MTLFQMYSPTHKRFAQRLPKSTTKVFNGQRIVDITTGTHHCLFLTDNGAVYGCGSNTYSQLGFPSEQMEHALISMRIEFPLIENGNENENVAGAAVRITQIWKWKKKCAAEKRK